MITQKPGFQVQTKKQPIKDLQRRDEMRELKHDLIEKDSLTHERDDVFDRKGS